MGLLIVLSHKNLAVHFKLEEETGSSEHGHIVEPESGKNRILSTWNDDNKTKMIKEREDERINKGVWRQREGQLRLN